MPAPPIPAIQIRRPSSGELKKLLGNFFGGVWTCKLKHRFRHVREPARIVEQRANQLRSAPGLALRDDDRAATTREVARVLRLMVGRGEETGYEHCRLAGGSELPDGAAC